MSSYKKLSDCLDIFVRKIAKTGAPVPGTGLLNGKTGIAILLYYYARYRNDPKITAYADDLIDLIIQEINLGAGKSFDYGLSGVAWGINHLVEQGFLESGDDLFDEIDEELLKEEDYFLDSYYFGVESGNGLYLLARMTQRNSYEDYRHNMAEYFRKIHLILTLRYRNIRFPMFKCKDIASVIHVCDHFRDDEFYRSVLAPLCRELNEIMNMAFLMESNSSDKYVLYHLLQANPCFTLQNHYRDRFTSATLTDVNSFYLNQLILGRNIPVPEVIHSTLLSIVEDKKRTDELLGLLNPQNAGLENDATGLAWSILQRCMAIDDLKNVQKQVTE